MPADDRAGDVTEDAILGGRLRLRQPERGHRVGHDAILLAAACPASAGERVVDLGAGVGAAPGGQGGPGPPPPGARGEEEPGQGSSGGIGSGTPHSCRRPVSRPNRPRAC